MAGGPESGGTRTAIAALALVTVCALGAFRELVGQGSILARMDMLLGGEPLRGLELSDRGFLLAILPPGAFFSLALAVAAKNALDRRRKQKLGLLAARQLS